MALQANEPRASYLTPLTPEKVAGGALWAWALGMDALREVIPGWSKR